MKRGGGIKFGKRESAEKERKIPTLCGSDLIYMGHGLRTGNIYAIVRCHQFLSGFLTNEQVPRVSCRSRLLVNDLGDRGETEGYAQIWNVPYN